MLASPYRIRSVASAAMVVSYVADANVSERRNDGNDNIGLFLVDAGKATTQRSQTLAIGYLRHNGIWMGPPKRALTHPVSCIIILHLFIKP